jgi:glycosyltransferase involved in cell wall biosynthesis
MNRYARELFAAIGQASGATFDVDIEQPAARPYVSRLWDSDQAARIDRAWCRYVTYPSAVHRRHASVFHILDQAYAHLIRSLDPDRTVITCHDLIPLLADVGAVPIHLPATVIRTFRWRIRQMTNARKVIADSAATKATLERYTSVPSDRIAIVPLGVDAAFRRLPDDGLDLHGSVDVSDRPAVLLHVATNYGYKNTEGLLHAFAELRSHLQRDVVLVRVGAPLTPDETRLAVRLGLADSIRYAGIVDEETLVRWYNTADILVFPSLWEGFGWPPLEAMACGTPVVASDIPAIAEVVGDAGILVPLHDPSAFARAAERVLTDAALAATLRQRGIARASHFTWARTAAATIAVYDEVLQ